MDPVEWALAPALTRWLKVHGAKLIVVGWAAAWLVVMATLMVGHWFTLPRPSTTNPRLRAGLASLRGDATLDWQVTHFLYVHCRCSRRILEHLLRDPRPLGVSEVVVLVGDDEAFRRRAVARGFEVVVVRADELSARFGVTGAPLFAVADGERDVRYLGGYTDRKQALDVRDGEVVDALRNGGMAWERPLFGCATSLELQRMLDPLGVKY